MATTTQTGTKTSTKIALITLSLAGIALAGVVAQKAVNNSKPVTQIGPAVTVGLSCSDSDSGINYKSEGTVIVKNVGNDKVVATKKDTCGGVSNSSNKLTEYYCDSASQTGYSSVNFNCSCVNGKCDQLPCTTDADCRDSDMYTIGICKNKTCEFKRIEKYYDLVLKRGAGESTFSFYSGGIQTLNGNENLDNLFSRQNDTLGFIAQFTSSDGAKVDSFRFDAMNDYERNYYNKDDVIWIEEYTKIKLPYSESGYKSVAILLPGREATIATVDLTALSTPQSSPSVSTCTDSDGGKAYTIKGTAKAGSVSKTDACYDKTKKTEVTSCSGANCGINEFYCANGAIQTDLNYTACANGCSKGVCLSSVSLKAATLNQAADSSKSANKNVASTALSGCLDTYPKTNQVIPDNVSFEDESRVYSSDEIRAAFATMLENFGPGMASRMPERVILTSDALLSTHCMTSTSGATVGCFKFGRQDREIVLRSIGTRIINVIQAISGLSEKGGSKEALNDGWAFLQGRNWKIGLAAPLDAGNKDYGAYFTGVPTVTVTLKFGTNTPYTPTSGTPPTYSNECGFRDGFVAQYGSYGHDEDIYSYAGTLAHHPMEFVNYTHDSRYSDKLLMLSQAGVITTAQYNAIKNCRCMSTDTRINTCGRRTDDDPFVAGDGDTCVGDNTLSESSCNGGSVGTQNITCQYGCEANACKRCNSDCYGENIGKTRCVSDGSTTFKKCENPDANGCGTWNLHTCEDPGLHCSVSQNGQCVITLGQPCNGSVLKGMCTGGKNYTACGQDLPNGDSTWKWRPYACASIDCCMTRGGLGPNEPLGPDCSVNRPASACE